MKVLWLVNVKIPEIYTLQGKKNKTYVGGWLSGLFNSLTSDDRISKLIICYPGKEESGKTERLNYYTFGKDKHDELADYFVSIISEERPDIIHIHGTEFAHSLMMIQAAKRSGMLNRTVCSIQGLVSFYAEHYYADVPDYVVRSCTLKEAVKRTRLVDLKRNYQRRGKQEIEVLLNCHHIIGRTSWDRACAYLINPKANYYHCNETLRKEFYTGGWSYSECRPHSVMLSQGTKPIKGLHMAIKALGIVRRFYPDVIAYVAGDNILKGSHLRKDSYSRYIEKLIEENGLKGQIIFTGGLDATQMKEKMLSVNAFVLPSSIENSPNSLGEAMLLGVPCVASDVGGVTDMMAPNKEGLVYPFTEYYKLAYYLVDLFRQEKKAEIMGECASIRARKTHDAEKNAEKTISIYSEIIGEEGYSETYR